ncbi:ankyrin repeat-containing domain protein [Aspergillus floccosus]
MTPLCYCLLRGTARLLPLLNGHGDDINFKVDGNTTHLCNATSNENNSLCEALLSHGADVNLQGDEGRTPLIIAVIKGNISLVRLLCRWHADIKSKDNKGRTALWYALERCNKDIAIFLLANLTMLDKEMLSGLKGVISGVLHEYSHNGKDCVDSHGWSALQTALDKGDELCVMILLRLGASIHVRNCRGQTPIHVASGRGYESILQALVRGADLDFRDLKGRTAMHLAVEGGHEGVVRMLIDNGADVHLKDLFGRTPLQ